jgi:hypothetical protein
MAIRREGRVERWREGRKKGGNIGQKKIGPERPPCSRSPFHVLTLLAWLVRTLADSILSLLNTCAAGRYRYAHIGTQSLSASTKAFDAVLTYSSWLINKNKTVEDSLTAKWNGHPFSSPPIDKTKGKTSLSQEAIPPNKNDAATIRMQKIDERSRDGGV